MIIGRQREQKLLQKVYDSKEAQFICVYGRRRVGKTFLVNEFFEHKDCIFFHVTGMQNSNMKKQLAHFTTELSKTFFKGTPVVAPQNWEGALGLLQKHIEHTDKQVILFFDEFPWLATKKSGLLEEIEYFWNQHWSKISRIRLIVCGSSASWLIKKIIYNKGGLHNRITCQIQLLPLTLKETKMYLHGKGIQLNNEHILNLYMALGGVPYYLNYVEKGLTAQQNIQQIVFDSNAPLRDEFDKLFASLFKNADAYVELIKLIAKNRSGVSRTELKELAKLSLGGGRLTERLRDLTAAGFVEEHIPWNRKHGEYYKLIDEFCLFHLHWIGSKKHLKFVENYWAMQCQKPAYNSWAGYAFEAICLKHSNQIINALNIPTAITIESWRFIPKKSAELGAQIDMLIDRDDDALTLCEIKYTNKKFSIDKAYAINLQRKMVVFKKQTQTKKQIFFAFISVNGLKTNQYSEKLISNVVTLKDLMGE